MDCIKWTMLSQFVIFMSAVEYGIGRMNREVSRWMKSSGENSNDETDIPFIATRGYDSVVWSRMYSQDSAERTRRALLVRKIIQSSNHFDFWCFLLHHRKYVSQWKKQYTFHEWSHRCPCWFQLSSIVAEETLESVRAKGMVVGHTPQIHGVNWYLSFLHLNWTSFYTKDSQ